MRMRTASGYYLKIQVHISPCVLWSASLSKQFESCSQCFLEYQVSGSVTGSVEWQLRGILEAYSTRLCVKISSLHLILVTALLIIQRN